MTPRADTEVARGAGPLGRITEALASIAPVDVWRALVAFLATLLTVVTAKGGLFVFLPEAQTALAGGVCAALIAPSRRSSAVTAAFAVFLGMIVGPRNGWLPMPTTTGMLLSAATAGAGAAVFAFGAAALARQVPGSGRWLTWGVIVLIVANAWSGAIGIASSPGADATGNTSRTFIQILEDPEGTTHQRDMGDQFAYLKVFEAMKRGRPFYRTWSEELGANRRLGGTAGSSVVNYNMPTRFWLWEVLPGTAVSVLYAYLTLMTLAVMAVPFVVRGSVRRPLAIPGAAAMAVYLFVHGGWLTMLAGEVWAGELAVLALAAWSISNASSRWRAWTVASVALGVLAALMREPAALVLIAGLVAACLIRGPRRRFRAVAWAAGLASYAGLYVLHAMNARPYLTGPTVGAVLRVMGVDTIVSALTFNTTAMGVSVAVPLALAAIGFLGMPQFRDKGVALFAGLVAVLSMAAYLMVNNAARDAATGAVINYWGSVIVPVIYACIPVAFAVVPGMAPAAPGPGGSAPADRGEGRPRRAKPRGQGG